MKFFSFDGASCAVQGGLNERSSDCRRHIWRVLRRCVCGNAASVHPSGQNASHILPNCTGMASHLEKSQQKCCVDLPYKQTYVSFFCCNIIYSCDGKAEFSAAITPVFSVTWSFRKHSNILICCSIMSSGYYYIVEHFVFIRILWCI